VNKRAITKARAKVKIVRENGKAVKVHQVRYSIELNAIKTTQIELKKANDLMFKKVKLMAG
jgi:hypothetical protein